MKFNNWIDTLIEEKNIDLEEIFEFENQNGFNQMPYGVVIEAMKKAPEHEKRSIKDTIVKIDFANGDVKHFLRHLGNALAA